MINLYCTQKLLAKLPVKEGLLPEGEKLHTSANDNVFNNPISGWHANLLTLQDQDCLLLVHDQTRFPVLLTGLKKTDFAALDYHFVDTFMNTLLKIGADEDQMHAAQDLLAPVCINKAHDRSVQGTMNQMKGSLEHMLWYDDINIADCSAYSTSAWLADRPCSVKSREPGAAKSKKDWLWPNQAMLTLLDDSH